MKAQSQAFVTEDGTAVKKNEKVCSYFAIAQLRSFYSAKKLYDVQRVIYENIFYVNLNSIA